MREIHVNKQNPRYSQPENRSKNYVPKRNQIVTSSLFGSKATNLVIQQPCQTQSMFFEIYKIYKI